VTVDAAIERLYDLNPGTTPVAEGSPHERPHKSLLLLAALDLIDDGLASPDRIPWCQPLRDRFSARLSIFRISAFQLLPNMAFHPDGQGLSWRLARWIASLPLSGTHIRSFLRYINRQYP
jgi:hypothetical protein